MSNIIIYIPLWCRSKGGGSNPTIFHILTFWFLWRVQPSKTTLHTHPPHTIFLFLIITILYLTLYGKKSIYRGRVNKTVEGVEGVEGWFVFFKFSQIFQLLLKQQSSSFLYTSLKQPSTPNIHHTLHTLLYLMINC